MNALQEQRSNSILDTFLLTSTITQECEIWTRDEGMDIEFKLQNKNEGAYVRNHFKKAQSPKF